MDRSMTQNFRETHSKLFKRHDTTIHRPYERANTEAIKTKTLFAMMREVETNPFEQARESKATWGQIVIINMCMFA